MGESVSTAETVRYEAEVNWPVIRRLALIAAGIVAFFIGRSYYARHLEQQASALEDSIFQIQLGIPIEEAVALMGRPPDNVDSGAAIFGHGGATLYHV